MDLLKQRLTDLEQELRDLHPANRRTAATDAQKAGHTAEGVWVRVIREMLPPGYRVLTRKYMEREVDIVILPASAPSFYDKADVTEIPSRVASAVVHVKNTLTRETLRDAMRRVHDANVDPPEYRASAAREREGLPSGIVALGSGWKGGYDSFRRAFTSILSDELPPTHPAQIPGFVGTPDWDMHNITTDMGSVPGEFAPDYQKGDPRWQKPHVVKLVSGTSSGLPVHSFVQWLYTACAATDPGLEPMRVAITQMFSLSGTSGIVPFELDKVYSPSRLRR